MIRTHIGLPPSSPLYPPPPPFPLFPLMPRGCIAKASLTFTNASQKYRWYITDRLSEQSAIVTECSANIRLYRRCFGEHSPNHRKSIFFIRTAGIYAQNRKASGSIACIIIHFTIADVKNPQWDRGISHIPHYVGHLCTLTISLNWPLFACSWNSYYAVGLLKYMAVRTCTNLFHSGRLHCK